MHIERISFQIEQSHWFYQDFIQPVNNHLTSYTLKQFSQLMFQHCPLLDGWKGSFFDPIRLNLLILFDLSCWSISFNLAALFRWPWTCLSAFPRLQIQSAWYFIIIIIHPDTFIHYINSIFLLYIVQYPHLTYDIIRWKSPTLSILLWIQIWYSNQNESVWCNHS